MQKKIECNLIYIILLVLGIIILEIIFLILLPTMHLSTCICVLKGIADICIIVALIKS